MSLTSIKLAIATTILLAANIILAQDQNDNLKVYYDQATYLESTNGNFKMKAELRMQFRGSSPFDDNPTSIFDLQQANNTDFALNRSRLKFEGFAYKPEINYKVEYDFNNATLLDGRLTYWFDEKIGLRFGRYKVNFNPERVRSSKDLQVVERSIVNQYFTLDRQQGFSLLGHLGKNTLLDSHYSIEVFNGNGRTESNTDEHLLTVFRYQWNVLGGKIETAMGDMKFREKSALNIAFSAANNTSPYTAFSSSGGKQLPGYQENDSGEYQVKQWLVDINYKYNGFSFLTEYHQKEITNKLTNTTNNLSGLVVNTGIFPHQFIKNIPVNLELALRYATVDTNELLVSDKIHEYTFAANWFFNGHRNKITVDTGNYSVQEQELSATEWRYRLQWDISF